MKKPAVHKHTPAGGAPTAPHTADEAQALAAAEHTDEPRIDIPQVTDLLLGTWADTRREAREMIKNPDFWRIEGQPMPEHRDRVLNQLKLLVDAGGSRRAFPKEFGGLEDNGANIAGFEELVLADPSLQIKSGVQWGLFGSAVYQLGTQKHWDAWLSDIIDLSLPGAFAMTETGHGSDVAAIGTTATYDTETEEFVIHTPFRGAWKDYLGNAALHGKAASSSRSVTKKAGSSPASAARTTATRAASTASTTAGCISTRCACRASTCSTATVRSPRTAATRATSRARGAASSRCSAPSCRVACRSTGLRPRPPRWRSTSP
jgi:hypothetical protein